MAQYDTVLALIPKVGLELGLGSLTAAYNSEDPNVLQLLQLLESVGRALVLENPWLQAKTDYTFTTTTATEYLLPSSFVAMVDGTGWNRTTRQPLVPLTPEQWEQQKAIGTTVVQPAYFRITIPAGVPTLTLLTAPTSGQTVALEYRSLLWVATSLGASPTKDAPNATADVPYLHSLLLVRALKLAFKRGKGMDSSTEQTDFEDTLNSLRGANPGASPTLSMSGRTPLSPLLGYRNVPETGYGS